MKRLRLGVLASGGGSNLQAIIDRSAAGTLDAEVVVIISNNSKSGALKRARNHGIGGFHISALTEGGAWVTVIRGELKPRFRSTDLVCIGDPGDSKVAGLVHRLSGDLRVSRRRASRRAPLPFGLAEIWRPKSGTILVGSNPWDETRRVVLVEGFAPPQSREPAQRPDPLAAWRG